MEENLESKVPLIQPQSVSVIQTESPSKKSRNDLISRIGAAVFYGVASFMIMVVNKHVLTIHKFPSFQVSFFPQFLGGLSEIIYSLPRFYFDLKISVFNQTRSFCYEKDGILFLKTFFLLRFWV